MIRRFLQHITHAWLPPARVIFDREGKDPYLSRWYLLGRPTMADGSEPFNETGQPREGIVAAAGLGIYLHRFHKGDGSAELHNHPWEWALSFVLAGGYSEERINDFGSAACGSMVRRRHVGPGSVNLLLSGDFHRVDLYEHDAWSLFVTGPKFQGWGFLDRVTFEFVGWREYIAKVRAKL